ncbi:hypothetical protein EDD65_11046 [Keratinibaculum paraultunense]|uniref:SurA-like protein n=1 Tax=Keratinibaculum paraultunense TaxID=1278232 RepID=A0A4R3KRI5_9FIRM|nr:hypothetical protein [Keratinibaculum paraultunense]QQY79589.1 hypothetical protein JL105_10420 [Keratinibaculum paraultunense]TCS87612.1 hypothetical protein EDD65_11046 [Keratinibaculum paraultunense]
MKSKTKFLLMIMVFILILTLSGCKYSNVQANDERVNSNSKENSIRGKEGDNKNSDIMKDFRNMVENNNEPVDLINYIDENIEKVLPEERVEMIEKLELIQEKYIEKYASELFADDYQAELLSLSEIPQLRSQSKEDIKEYLFFNEANVEKITNDNLKELISKIIQGKYRLINLEGAFYPIIDYEALKVYDKYISDELKDYIDIKAMDSNEPTIIDGSLMISFDELAERLMAVENYIKKHSEGIRCEELLRLYGTYLIFYLEGADNTPIYDEETYKIKDEVLSSYKKTMKSKDTVLSYIIGKYMNIIEENQFIIDEDIISQITVLHNEAIAKLEECK